MKRCVVMLSAVVATLFFHGLPAVAESRPGMVTIGTGGVTGVYYPAGGAIAKIVNQTTADHGLRCSVESTDGSVYNIYAVIRGELDFGIAQSDRQYQAVHGTPGSEWEGHPQSELRAVVSLHDEICTLVAAEETGIATVEDLRGRTVTIGNPGSGHRKNAVDALTAFGIDWKTQLAADQSQPADAPSMLQKGLIDAFFYTIGHPAAAFKEVTMGARRVSFIPIQGEGIDRLLAEVPYYTRATIPVLDNYFGAVNNRDVDSFGVKATLVTSAKTPDAVVYAVVKALFTHIEQFRRLHPALKHLSAKGMLLGMSAPLHPGAATYFSEAGLHP